MALEESEDVRQDVEDDPMIAAGTGARAQELSREAFERRDDLDDLELLELLRPAKRPRGAAYRPPEGASTSQNVSEPSPSGHAASHPNKEVALAGRRFDSAAAVKRYLNSELLPSLQPGDAVQGEAAEVLHALFKHHPNYGAKLAGHDLAGFFAGEVRLTHQPQPSKAPAAGAPPAHKQRQQKCFWLRRSDGYEDDFSVNRCIEALQAQLKGPGADAEALRADGAPGGAPGGGAPEAAASAPGSTAAQALGSDAHARDVLKAMMGAVLPHLIWFRNFQLKCQGEAATCPFSGEALSRASAVAVNELPLTNAALIKEWMQARGVTFADIKVRKGEPGNPLARKFTARSMYEGWKQFYTEKSKLVLASRRGYQGRVMAHAIGALSMNTGL